jgi:restriction system protein
VTPYARTMAEVTRERTGQLVRAAFDVLSRHPEGLAAKQVLAEVERTIGLTEYERGDYESSPGTRRYEKILRFSTVATTKAGWLLKNRGIWTLTDDGRQAYAQFTDPAEFMREAVRRYGAWRKANPVVSDDDDGEEVDETITAIATVEEAEEQAWAEVEAYLVSMPAYEFQDLVAALLRAMGYHVTWVAPPGRDGGIDIVAYTDPLGATGPRIKAQVKRVTTSKVSVEGVRSFMAVLAGQDVGLFGTCQVG